MINIQRRLWTGKLVRRPGYARMAFLLIFFSCFLWTPAVKTWIDVRHIPADQVNVVKHSSATAILAQEDPGHRRQVPINKSSPARPVMKQPANRYRAMDLATIAGQVKSDFNMARIASGLYDTPFVGNEFQRYYLPDHPDLIKHQLEWSVAEYVNQAGQSATTDSRGSLTGKAGKLSPYDGLVRKYADKYGFDWRLIVAQMYQESQFDPGALSYAGAEGLMQVMPATATTIGAGNLADPEANIRAGIKYLSLLRNQFASDPLLEERTWFLLASYNAGPGRVNLARRKAATMGLDPNRWFGNVETAMLALAEPVEKDGEMVRNCRCGQTVVYVKEIRRIFHNYVRLTRAGQVASVSVLNTSPYDI